MAIGAGRPAFAFVRIIFGVAGDTCLLRLANGVACTVATGTGRSGMLADQREGRVTIVIEGCVFPVGRIVA